MAGITDIWTILAAVRAFGVRRVVNWSLHVLTTVGYAGDKKRGRE
jgi:hypothetical protein